MRLLLTQFSFGLGIFLGIWEFPSSKLQYCAVKTLTSIPFLTFSYLSVLSFPSLFFPLPDCSLSVLFFPYLLFPFLSFPYLLLPLPFCSFLSLSVLFIVCPFLSLSVLPFPHMFFPYICLLLNLIWTCLEPDVEWWKSSEAKKWRMTRREYISQLIITPSVSVLPPFIHLFAFYFFTSPLFFFNHF